MRLFSAARARPSRNAVRTRGFQSPQNTFRVYNFFTNTSERFENKKKTVSTILLKRRSRCVNRTCASNDDDDDDRSSIHSSALAVLFELVSEASFPGKRIFDGSIFGFRFAYGVG